MRRQTQLVASVGGSAHFSVSATRALPSAAWQTSRCRMTYNYRPTLPPVAMPLVSPYHRSRYRTSLHSVPTPRSRRWDIYLIAGLPIVDAIANQVHTCVPQALGPLSVLQVLRGASLAFIAARLFVIFRLNSPSCRKQFEFTLLFTAWIGFVSAKEVYANGTLTFESAVHYLQMLHWLLLWLWCLAVIPHALPSSIRLVLRGLVVGALLTSLSVYVGYLTRMRLVENYGREGATASFGWFTDGNSFNGALLVGGLVAPIAIQAVGGAATTALLCFGAVLLTYKRVSSIACLAALAWTVHWACGSRIKWARRWARSLLVISLAFIVVGIANAPLWQGLERRWSDVKEYDTAGSGRLRLWYSSVHHFTRSDAWTQLVGCGYSGMSAAMRRSGQGEVHAHSDLFDMVVMGGITGVILLLMLWTKIARLFLRLPTSSPYYLVAMAVYIVYLIHSTLTGQLFVTNIMGSYIIAVMCLTEMGTRCSRPTNDVSRLR